MLDFKNTAGYVEIYAFGDFVRRILNFLETAEIVELGKFY